MSDDPIGDALRADAEAARAEIRAEGIACPSCGVNMADLPEGHQLDVSREEPYTAKCASGKLAELGTASQAGQPGAFETWQAVANIALWDQINRHWSERIRRDIIGERGGDGFMGLLGTLKDGRP